MSCRCRRNIGTSGEESRKTLELVAGAFEARLLEYQREDRQSGSFQISADTEKRLNNTGDECESTGQGNIPADSQAGTAAVNNQRRVQQSQPSRHQSIDNITSYARSSIAYRDSIFTIFTIFPSSKCIRRSGRYDTLRVPWTTQRQRRFYHSDRPRGPRPGLFRIISTISKICRCLSQPASQSNTSTAISLSLAAPVAREKRQSLSPSCTSQLAAAARLTQLRARYYLPFTNTPAGTPLSLCPRPRPRPRLSAPTSQPSAIIHTPLQIKHLLSAARDRPALFAASRSL